MIYLIGTFVQVHEVQNLGNQLKLMIAHKRIKIVNQIFEDGNPKIEYGRTRYEKYI